MDFSSTDIIGYLASLGVLLSFLMKEIKTLRIVNILGCFLFVIYGVMLNFSWPIIITNVSIIIINLYYLFKISGNKN
jgi:hypothetical protein